MNNFDAPPRRVGAHFGGPARAARRRDLQKEIDRFWAEILSSTDGKTALDAFQNWHLSAAGPRTMSHTSWLGCYQKDMDELHQSSFGVSIEQQTSMEIVENDDRGRRYCIMRKFQRRVERRFKTVDWEAVGYFYGIRRVASKIMAVERMNLGEELHDEWPDIVAIYDGDEDAVAPPWEITINRWMILYGHCLRILVHRLCLRVSARKCWSAVRRSLPTQRCKRALLQWYDEVAHRPEHSGAKRAKRSYEECARIFV